MADNVNVTPGTGAVVAADDVGGAKHQRVKISLGADGSATDAEGGSGASNAGTQRTVTASDSPDVVSLAVMDDWDESDRAKVNIIVGQAGVAAGAGAVGASVQRMTLASDDPGVASLTAIETAVEIMDDWDESDRAKVNPIVGQAGVSAGSGAVDAATQRVILATNDPGVTALAAIQAAVQIMDDWDETDRAKVNIIVGQAGVAAGAGAVGATVPRVTLASDDPAVASLAVLDDWDESDRAKVNPIVGQAGVAAGAGAVSATVQRITLASDDPLIARIGEVQASPTANTVLDRLKALLTGIILAAGEAHVGEVGGRVAVASGSVTRPADTTAYAAGDLVANSTTAGSVTPISFTVGRGSSGSSATGLIRRARLRKTGTSVTNAIFRLHLYSASPGVTNGDNGAWLSDNAANYIGAIDFLVDKAFSDGAAGNGVPLVGSELFFTGQTVYGLIEARGAYTPASGEQFSIGLSVVQN